MACGGLPALAIILIEIEPRASSSSLEQIQLFNLSSAATASNQHDPRRQPAGDLQ
eukprot:SAG25_NODE_10489_length_332_cov_0.660944_1_plen_54_part_10